MKKLVVLDYCKDEVHFYKVEDSRAVNEEYIESLGFHASECEWMIGKCEVVEHKGILV